MNKDTKKVFLATWGCQMNVRDSEVICGLLERNGYKITEDMDGADIILFNTCSVRQHAEDKVWSEIGRVAKGVSRSTKKIVGLLGCMAQNYKDAIFGRAPNVDFVVGPQDIHKIPGIIKKFTEDSSGDGSASGARGQGAEKKLFERKVWETDGQSRPEEIYHNGVYLEKDHAYVVISEGCSNYCSYCIVPYVRGELRSRHYKDILSEIEQAVASGRTKITLLGQNVCAYQGIAYSVERRADSKELSAKRYPLNAKTYNFVQLLELVNQIKGLEEFSFITSHPRDTSVELFQAMQSLDKLKKYLHLPVQSGSDRILKLMNRGYTRKYYLELIENYRKIVKDGILTSDIIVGFPAETEEDFQATYDLVKEAEFNAAFIFKYSTRPYTRAASMADDVTKEEKKRRHSLILELHKVISKEKNE